MAKEKKNFGAEVEKILQLMIHSLYEHKEIFLRELISNASDACDKLRYKAITEPKLLGENPELKISISFDKSKNIIEVSDTGIGMSREEMVENLGTIARSGTQNFVQELTGDKKKDTNLIGQFGVGFYSSFMVADKVTVFSKCAGGEKIYRWESEGKGEYNIEEDKAEIARGTIIRLHLREDSKEFLDKWRLSHIIRTYSDHIAFPVELKDEAGKCEVINSASALWLRPKSEITEEQYKEFYRHVGQSGDEPWMILHNKAEGAIEYTNLLYIPSIKPFDLFHPDRIRRVKLYVRRVFITDQNIDIIPPYLRFMRGVVDSEDLPLNISRETLQHNIVVSKIRNSITKKVLSELEKKANDDVERFNKFWENFGPVLKEGLCDANEPRDELLAVCRFRSTVSGDQLTSLKDYKSRMKNGQEAIYYLIGDDYKALLNSPHLEAFKDKGIEVLLLSDTVDDFWVNVVNKFDAVELRSVTRVSDEIDNVGDNVEKNKKSEKSAKNSKDIDGLIDFIQKTLGDKIKSVRISNKLKESPVCLAVQEGAMDIRMERFLVENKQLPGKMTKILEINPKHKIIKSLARDFKDSANQKKIEDAVFLLFCQASILEGDTPTDITEFSRRMNKMLEQALVA